MTYCVSTDCGYSVERAFLASSTVPGLVTTVGCIKSNIFCDMLCRCVCVCRRVLRVCDVCQQNLKRGNRQTTRRRLGNVEIKRTSNDWKGENFQYEEEKSGTGVGV